MKKKQLKKIQRKAFIFEIFFLLICVGLVGFFIAVQYIKAYRYEQKTALDNVTRKYADFLNEFEYLPQNIIESPYVAFVIDESNDEYIIPRYSRVVGDDLLWEQHSKKLIYQMQKHRQGWVSYPFKKPWQFFTDNKMLRFLVVDSLGWIIALESHQLSEWKLIKNVFPLSVVIQIISVLLVIFALMRLNIYHFTKNFKSNMLDSLEKNYLQYENAPKEKSKPQPETFKDIAPSLDHLINRVEKQASQSKKVESPLSDFNKIPPKKKTLVAESHNATVQQSVANQHILDNKKLDNGPQPSVLPSSDDHNLALDGIQSTVLKQLIKDLREE